MLDNLSRLGVFAEAAEGEELALTDIQVDGLTYSIEETGEGLRWVTTTGGTVTSDANFQPPSGPLLDRMDIEAPQPEIVEVDMADEPMSFAVVEVEGSWYVSLYYTAAETLRRDEGDRFPGLGAGPAPVGADSPDAVLEDLAARMIELDAEGVLTLLDPSEAAALYDYSPLFLPEFQVELNNVLAEAEAAGVSWNLDAIDYTAAEQNGRQVVSFNSMTMSFSIEGESGTVRISDGCLVADVAGESIDTCDEADQYADVQAELLDGMKTALDLSDATLAALEKLEAVDAGFTVVERDGRWYLSLVPSAFGVVNDHLAVLNSGDLEAMITDIEEIGEDPEGFITELDDLTGGMALESFNMINPLGTGQTFVPVDDALVEGDGSFSFGGSEMDNLLPGYESWDASVDSLYLGWDADLAGQPAFVAGAYLFGDSDGSIEVAQFEGPVDPAILDGWTLQEVGGVVYATSEFGNSSYAFVNNYVIWAGSDSESVDMLMAQVDLLK